MLIKNSTFFTDDGYWRQRSQQNDVFTVLTVSWVPKLCCAGRSGARYHIMIIIVQVKIEGFPGEDYRSDIAIDDISSSDYTNKCKRKTTTNHQPFPDILNLSEITPILNHLFWFLHPTNRKLSPYWSISAVSDVNFVAHKPQNGLILQLHSYLVEEWWQSDLWEAC